MDRRLFLTSVIKQLKREGRNDEKIHRGDSIGVVAQECLPPLRWGFPVPCRVFGDRGLANFDAEFEELAVDPRSTPQRIGETHFPDQLANFERYLWSAAARSRLPSPEQAKTSAMPADDRLRLYDHQGIHNAWRNPKRLAKMRRSKLLKASRFGDFLRSTLSWWRNATISASSEARGRKSPTTTNQISLSISPMRRSIARFAALR
jgi:hypothetical protein